MKSKEEENMNKEIWYGFDKYGRVAETFHGTFAEAVEYFNSEYCNFNVQCFDRKHTME